MYRLFSIHSFAICSSIALFFFVSQILFDEVFLTSKIIIDEEFHIPQGLAYCNFTFNTWNRKITTLPGLYLISAAVLGPFSLCTIYWLRFVNLVVSVLNLLLFYFCFNLFHTKKSRTNFLSSINLSLLPPLYFFSFLYYTDVISLTFILLLILFDKKEKQIVASVCGMMAVIMRQTNIIWVLMIFGQYVLKEVISQSSIKQTKNLTDNNATINDLICVLRDLKSGLIFKRWSLNTWLNIASYTTVLFSFALFVIVNGSIVVGDKSAHRASLHLPQIFYFVTFCLVFGWPHFVVDALSFLQFMRTRKIITILLLALFAIIVHFNTLEHPYLLADNRHYTFYIWNRLFRKYSWFRYFMIPIYYFGFYSLSLKLYQNYNILHILLYVVCTLLVLVLQKMIEIRYFLIPYIFLRLHLKNVNHWQLLGEFATYCFINIVTFYIFFTKDIYWSDFLDVQKLIW